MSTTWKKMAEAFGQAYGRDYKLNKMNKRGLSDESRLLLKGKRSSDDTDAMQQFTHGTNVGKRDFNKANDRAVEKADLAGKDSYNSSDVESELDDIVDKRSDAALQKDFDEAFEESFNKAKGTFNEAMDKLGGYAPEDKEQAYGRLRQLMIDKLKSGEPIQDVLDWGKNKYILIK